MKALAPLRARAMSPTEAAWLAGFLDGEGSIARYTGGKYKSECWKICIPNTNVAALEHIIAITGTGKVSRKRPADDRRQAQYQWQISSKRDMERIVTQLLPYLQIKRSHADKLLEFVARTNI